MNRLVEKLFEIEIDHDVVAVGDVTLRLSHCLMGGAPRSKAVTGIMPPTFARAAAEAVREIGSRQAFNALASDRAAE